jgi:uncharacterized membrane protein
MVRPDLRKAMLVPNTTPARMVSALQQRGLTENEHGG